MFAQIAIFAAGLLGWTFLEYAIHGWLSHRLHTFATPLHAAHHRNPHAVFALGAWPAAAAAAAALVLGLGLGAVSVFYLGLLSGFAAYEAIHYRLHFARPRNRWEASLRRHHLAHHLEDSGRCFGVTTRLWDRVFGTDLPAVRPGLDEIAPLTGPSNLGTLAAFAAARLRAACSW